MTHGAASRSGWTKGYSSWHYMRSRCNNPNNKNYDRYGGRGIKICDRWNDFNNFIADMGEPEEGMTLERIDGDKGYSLENCKWATMEEQARNRSTTKLSMSDAIAIVKLRRTGLMYYQIAEKYGVDKVLVGQICRGERWNGAIEGANMTTYRIEVYKESEDDDNGEATWDAEDWCFMVLDTDSNDDIFCICATHGEAEHIVKLLTKEPYVAATVTSQ